MFSSGSPVSCSFAGGCLLSIPIHGLASSMINEGANVTVCENLCILDESESDSVTAKCRVPSLATSYSVEHYQIEEEAILLGTVFSTEPTT